MHSDNFLRPGYKVSKILHIVYILALNAYRVYPSGKYLTLAIKPNKKDGQGDVSMIQLGYMK